MKYKGILLAICATLALAALTGCHTMAGAGQDVSETGQSITRAAS